MRHKPGSAAVSGPIVRVWFSPTRIQTGRLAHAEDANQGRFEVYTDGVHGLRCVLVNAAAAKRIKVFPDTERAATFTPRQEGASGGGRLGLSGPGPTAVGSQEMDAALERAHERTDQEQRRSEPEAAAPADETPESAPAPEQAADTGESPVKKKPAPKKPPPSPPPGSDRYINRRGKPRI